MIDDLVFLSEPPLNPEVAQTRRLTLVTPQKNKIIIVLQKKSHTQDLHLVFEGNGNPVGLGLRPLKLVNLRRRVVCQNGLCLSAVEHVLISADLWRGGWLGK